MQQEASDAFRPSEQSALLVCLAAAAAGWSMHMPGVRAGHTGCHVRHLQSMAALRQDRWRVQEEARDAFRELLEATKVGSDWTWESTMRKIIADPR